MHPRRWAQLTDSCIHVYLLLRVRTRAGIPEVSLVEEIHDFDATCK